MPREPREGASTTDKGIPGDTRHRARDRSLDITKGIAIAMVLYMHLMPVSFLPGPVLGPTGRLASLLVNAPYRWLCKPAVPAFYLVSSIIYLRSWTPTSTVLYRRLKGTAFLLAVWLLVEYAWVGVIRRGLPSVTLGALLVGGPAQFGLYFLADLMLLYFVMEAVCRLRATVGEASARRFAAWVVAAFGLALFALPFLGVTSVPYWSPWPFAVYPALAIFIDAPGMEGRRSAAVFGALFVVGVVADVGWRLAGVDMNQLGYARLPALAGAVLVLLLGRLVDERDHRVTRNVAALGRHSLGLFVMHPLVILLLVTAVPIREIAWAGGVLTLRLAQAGGAFMLTLATVLLLARSRLRVLVASGPPVPDAYGAARERPDAA